MQSCGHCRHLCARHLAACSAKKALDLSLILGVLGRGIIHGQLNHRTDATKLTAGKLTAAVAHESLWDAIREDGGLQDCHHLSDRLPLIQSTGDDRAGMVVQDGNQIAIKAVVLAGVERTDVHRPHGVRRQRFKGVPMAWRAWDRWHRWRILAQDTLYGIGGDDNALVVEDVCQALLAKAGVLGLGMQHGIYDALRLGGAVDTGRTITGGQTPLRGLLAIFIKGLPGDAEEPGDHGHTEDLRRDQSQYAAFEVVQLGLNLDWQ
jgi:hypothetical protein